MLYLEMEHGCGIFQREIINERQERCRIINCYSVNQNSSVFHSSLYIYPCSWQMSLVLYCLSDAYYAMQKNDKHLRRRNLGLNWGLTAWNFFGILDNTSLPISATTRRGIRKKKRTHQNSWWWITRTISPDYVFLIFFRVIPFRESISTS